MYLPEDCATDDGVHIFPGVEMVFFVGLGEDLVVACCQIECWDRGYFKPVCHDGPIQMDAINCLKLAAVFAVLVVYYVLWIMVLDLAYISFDLAQ